MLNVDVYYSLRSPYCYLLTPRLVSLAEKWQVTVNIRPVYPIAVRDPDFFKRVDPLYRSYHMLDSARVAEHLAIPYRRPVPDPIVQDLATNEISAEQPFIYRLTRLCMAAAEQNGGLAFVAKVMPLLWDGSTDNWHEGDHLKNAMTEAGLSADDLERRVAEDFAALDAAIEANQIAERKAGHWGVPLMVFDGEPFAGQDRFSYLLWRLKQRGLKPRNTP